jgi:hypothetical protein
MNAKNEKRENARANYSHKRLFCTGREENAEFLTERKRRRTRERERKKKGIHKHTQNRRTFAPDQLYTHDNINSESYVFPFCSRLSSHYVMKLPYRIVCYIYLRLHR